MLTAYGYIDVKLKSRCSSATNTQSLCLLVSFSSKGHEDKIPFEWPAYLE